MVAYYITGRNAFIFIGECISNNLVPHSATELRFANAECNKGILFAQFRHSYQVFQGKL